MSQASLPRAAAHRIACAVVSAEVQRLRAPGAPQVRPDDWPETLAIGDEGLGLDSLEQLGALGALAETFDLGDAVPGSASPQTVGAWVDWIMHRHAPGDGRITVVTSGSTGRPLPCVHPVADLLDEAAFLAARVAGRRRVVALVPAHHLYGLIWTALLPAVLGVPVAVRTIGEPLGLAAGDLVVAVPDQWRAMLRLLRRFPADVVGVSSAGPLDDGLATDLLTAGLARLVDIYGSSETGGIALRDAPAAAYELLPRWRLLPFGDGDWQLGDERGAVHALPDHVERVGERGIVPVGRRDDAVQVGGHNVWPRRVADVLRAVEGVADAAVRLHGDGRLKAFVVPHDNTDPTGLSVRIEQAAAAHLTGPERPRRLSFGTALPRSAMGKLKDWA